MWDIKAELPKKIGGCMRAVFRKRPELNAQVWTIFLTSYFEIISDFQKFAKLTFCLTRVKLQKQENNTDTMLMIILIFWTLLKFCQCPFSHPGCNKGSHIAFSCHVLLVSFILKHFLSFLLRPMILSVLDSSFVEYPFIWIWCFLMMIWSYAYWCPSQCIILGGWMSHYKRY